MNDIRRGLIVIFVGALLFTIATRAAQSIHKEAVGGYDHAAVIASPDRPAFPPHIAKSLDSSSVGLCDLGSNLFPYDYITLDSVVRFHYCFRNNGVGTQIDTTGFSFKILDAGSHAVYLETLRVCCLAPGEERECDLPDFSPPALGLYTFKAYSLVGSDSITSTLHVVDPSPLVTGAYIARFPCSYSEIPVIDNGPHGDDSTVRAPLPFSFVCNGRTYDSLLISTNGFVQLGAAGRLLGSTMDESPSTGVHDNTVIPGTTHDHFLSPWHDDLNTSGPDANGDSGHVTYATVGTSPYRVFVVQWKNISSTVNELSTSARLNFQVRLYETSNVIDFIYGERVAGTFNNSQEIQGASIAIKDEFGGPYHYYDVFRGGYGNAGYLRTDLDPNTDWPGANICYRILRDTGLSVAILPRWNLVCTPIGGVNIPVQQVFPSAVTNTTYAYNHGYELAAALNQGRGYWTKFPDGQAPVLSTAALPFVDDSVNTGWNLIGTPDHDIAAPLGAIVNGPSGPAGTVRSVYVYDPRYGYETTPILHPGIGCWVKTDASGILTLGTFVPSKTSATSLDAYNSLTVKSGSRSSQTLYFGVSRGNSADLDQFDMPPFPPAGIFDFRFESGRMLETYPAVGVDSLLYGLELHSALYPVEVTWNIRSADGRAFAIVESENGKTTAIHPLNGKGSFLLTAGKKLSMKVSAGSAVPRAFSLQQNYPNPFNPVTTIQYVMPSRGFVTLKVYDVLGRTIATLVNEIQEEGFKSVEFNAASLASGIYMYEIHAGDFTAARKMLLMK